MDVCPSCYSSWIFCPNGFLLVGRKNEIEE